MSSKLKPTSITVLNAFYLFSSTFYPAVFLDMISFLFCTYGLINWGGDGGDFLKIKLLAPTIYFFANSELFGLNSLPPLPIKFPKKLFEGK